MPPPDPIAVNFAVDPGTIYPKAEAGKQDEDTRCPGCNIELRRRGKHYRWCARCGTMAAQLVGGSWVYDLPTLMAGPEERADGK